MRKTFGTVRSEKDYLDWERKAEGKQVTNVRKKDGDNNTPSKIRVGNVSYEKRSIYRYCKGSVEGNTKC